MKNSTDQVITSCMVRHEGSKNWIGKLLAVVKSDFAVVAAVMINRIFYCLLCLLLAFTTKI